MIFYKIMKMNFIIHENKNNFVNLFHENPTRKSEKMNQIEYKKKIFKDQIKL